MSERSRSNRKQHRATRSSRLTPVNGYDFRYNERERNDGERFVETAGSIGGKRLTYRALTAKRAGRGPAKGFDWRKKGEDERQS